ncbi:helix-turn-helix transcriptional regulator [Hahella chejuensis]|uniref:helix-turn-helix transcriptional regulator n=1 Tax=Hahella chejuensis TaxID=158327 RepID=UPI00059F9686|nr:YafY family protein [Hahella chejuensis]
MSRAERLLELMQTLRRYRYPVSGKQLASELGVSIRTLYRDIASLQAQGAHIEGEPGVGYLLRPGFMLPPLMFSDDEIEALVLGSRWVSRRGDAKLGEAARNVIAKIAAVIPAELRQELETSTLLIGPAATQPEDDKILERVRAAIRAERKLCIAYGDSEGNSSTRIIWPFAVGFFDTIRVVVAWCELREGFRHFRTDRIGELHSLEARIPRRRHDLLKEWREFKGVEPQ